MKKKLLFLSALLLTTATNGFAQRRTDALDRGLTAIKTADGVFCSWRILGEEYYDVKYNLYRNGTQVASNLEVSNFKDAAGTTDSKYTVKAVVRGVEEATGSKVADVWASNYKEITPTHSGLKSVYVPNDVCCADVDGDGQVEMLMKFDNQSEISQSYPKNGPKIDGVDTKEYSLFECLKMDGTRLWYINCGPNMGDFQNNEQNIAAYDWDGDGKAEVIMRAADGTTIYDVYGTPHVVGDQTKNYRAATGGGTNWFMHDGAEYLVYLNGETGVPYQIMEYPLKRLEDGETDLEKAWGDGYGHRSSKHFFGAPYLDGRKPSIFLARGIYTRHKMIALDVNPATHELSVRWRWNCNDSSSPWYGNGYHNYAIADVDWDGRDEICFGSMVIDDNGKGLSTTGLGHGDAQHHSDFNPYKHGHEIFACLEDNPGNNYRDATTAKIYHRFVSSKDDGRCIAGNFSNDYPGAMGFSGYDDPISCVTADYISGMTKGGIPDNFRIYWDGDLCDEGLNYSNGKNTAIAIYKYNKGALETLAGSLTNNDTKGTPCYQGDLFGDWREEVIARTADNKIRIYTTTIPTQWRNYTLWHDMQYRNAMVWQMNGYNQPPHVSYFLGELEGITTAPPALTNTNRTEILNGSSIGTALNNKQVMLAETNDMTVSVADGASPYIFFDNAPSWVQGHDNNNNITRSYFTHTLTGGAFTGSMRLVKQGDGTLVLPNVTETYTGNTDVWAGTLQFDGTMQSSSVWLNRHTNLISNGGTFNGGIKADYNATIYPGGKNATGNLTTTTLALGFGSRVVFDIAKTGTADKVNAQKLVIEKKDWQYGPEYAAPVFQFNNADIDALPAGNYLLGDITTIEGDINDIVLEGFEKKKVALAYEEGKLYLVIIKLRDATSVIWDGGEDGIWDFGETENFKRDNESIMFVTGDEVTFNDQASKSDITIQGVVAPGSIVFANNSKNFTLSGEGSIIDNTSITLQGEGQVSITNTNKFTGAINLNGGRLSVASLANNDGVDYAALGSAKNKLTFNNGTLNILKTMSTSHPFAITSVGTINVDNGITLTHNGAISGSGKQLVKTGNGTLQVQGNAQYGELVVNQGTVHGGEIGDVHTYPTNITLNGGTLKDPDNMYSYSTNRANVNVPEGKTATWTLDSRCYYKGKLTGKGKLTVNVTNTRSQMQGDWSQFEGTINFQNLKTGSYDPSIMWDNSYGLAKATIHGVFNNNGKNITIGAIDDNATLSGAGVYSVKKVNMKVTRARGNSTNTKIEAVGTLSITEEINVTWSGVSPKAGEEVILWKVGRLATSSSVIINLPTLPSGLEWDTSELLKKEGKLRVIEATAVKTLQQEDAHGQLFNLGGMPIDKPTKKGIYIRNGKKIIIK